MKVKNQAKYEYLPSGSYIKQTRCCENANKDIEKIIKFLDNTIAKIIVIKIIT